MRRNSRIWAGFIAVALVLGAGGLASAQGKGGGGGSAGTAAGALYGDLYVIERDGAGVPITRAVTYTDAETNQPVTVNCVQPLAESCALLPLWGECNAANTYPPGVLTPTAACTFNAELYDPCAVYANPDGLTDQFTDLIQEVKFGRESVSRAPATVIDKSYAEALKGINSAAAMCEGFAIKLDPAGRLTLCLASETVPVTWAWKTIDAPLENLGLYRAAMTNGCFGAVTEEKVGEEGVRVVATTALDPTGILYLNEANLPHLVCDYASGYTKPGNLDAATAQELACTVDPDPVGGPAGAPCGWELAITPDRTASTYKPGDGVTGADMLSAAVFMAAGADKTDPLTLDEVVNVNNYLGVNLWTYTTARKVKTLTITYFTFKDAAETSGWFTYNQGTDACKPGSYTPLLVTTDPTTLTFQTQSIDPFSPTASTSVNLKAVGIDVCRAGSPSGIVCDQASDPAYGTDNIMGCGGANWFTQTAEDARKTIWYLHNWRVPEIAY